MEGHCSLLSTSDSSSFTTSGSDEPRQPQQDIRSARILICTPCYAGMATANYTSSVLKASATLVRYGVQHDFFFMGNESLIQRGRNSCVQIFRANDYFTHLLFIDSDVGFEDKVILQLLLRDKEVIGAVYPDKGYNFANIQRASSRYFQTPLKPLTQDEQDDLVKNLVAFPIHPADDPPMIREGVLRVKDLHAGMLLLKRSAIERVIKHFPKSKYTINQEEIRAEFLRKETDTAENTYPEDNYNCRDMYAIFDCFIEDDEFYAEDHGFCLRYHQAGGEIFVDLTLAVSHMGNVTFAGDPLQSLITYGPSSGTTTTNSAPTKRVGM
jgi:hypothetical protein